MARDSLFRLAVRAYPQPAGTTSHKPSRWRQQYPGLLVLDMETRTDTKQSLMFGS